MKQIFALVDCNNFFVSCERVFNPHLEGCPVVVLSNNDGCIIARSNEAKALSIPMGMPLFEANKIIRHHGIHVYSSNYPLYGDMSARVMNALGTFSPHMEIYSIDEAFLGLAGFEHRGLRDYGLNIKNTIKQWTGIPVSIGIAETKTLAKIAGHIAKRSDKANGSFTITDESTKCNVLDKIKIRDIWGIGSRWAQMLNDQGVKTALDFHNLHERWVRKRMGITGTRTLLELRGQPCLNLESHPPDKKTIRVSRSFAKPVTNRQVLRESVAAFAARAAEKMRRNGLVCSTVNVFVMTNQFNPKNYYRGSASHSPPVPSNHTAEITQAAMIAFENVWTPGLQFKSAGVMMLGLVPVERIQGQLFFQPNKLVNERKKRLMVAFDKINRNIGNNTIRIASTGVDNRAKCGVYTLQNYRSPRYTTCWSELPIVQA